MGFYFKIDFVKLGKIINEAFSHVYVKNIPSAIKRLESFKKSANDIKLKYEVYKSIVGDLYVPKNYQVKYRSGLYPEPYNQYLVGNHLTWLSIHLDAMRNNYDSYVVCDDDTIFYDIDLPSIKDKLPDDWDIIVLGEMEKTITSNENINFIRTDPKLAGCQCLAVNKKNYYQILNVMLMFNEIGYTGDTLINYLQGHTISNTYSMYPNITHQERYILKPYTIE
jgi:hypothetical protein